MRKHNPTYGFSKNSWMAVLTFLLLVIFSADALAQVSGYSFRKRFDVDNTQVSGTSNLADFPVLVDITDPDLRSLANGGEVNNLNGYDIVFTSSDGSTLLNHELESYNPTTGRLLAWVRFPVLQATSDTPFYIYFGNSSVSTDPSTPLTWNSGYQLVHHYESGLGDATSVGNNGTNNGTASTAGKIGNARQFDATDFITVADNASLDITGNLSLSMWINGSNIGTGPDLISKGSWNESYSALLRTNGKVRSTINGARPLDSNSSLTNGSWYHLVITKTAGQRVVYLNGTADASSTNSLNYTTNNNPLNISSTAFPFNGVIDEVRVSTAVPTAGWVATEYANQNNPSSFVAENSEPPVLANIESTALTYNAGSGPTTITSSVTVSDPFYTNLQGASVQITSNYLSSEDSLAFPNSANITSSFDSGTGTLTLTGSAPVSEYETALRNVTYENTNTSSPDTSLRTVSFSVDNGIYVSNTVSRDIDVTLPLGEFVAFRVEQAPSGNITSKTAGQNFDISISAVDGGDNVVTTFEGTAEVSSTGVLGTGMGTTAAFTNGVLSAHTVSITSAGTFTISATNSSGSESGTSNSFSVSPAAASGSTSLISASPTVIQNDGASTSTITVQLKDQFGNNLVTGGDNVVLSTDNGSLSAVTDNGDGTYTATLTSSTAQVTATISGTVNSNPISDTAQVAFTIFDAIWQSSTGNVTNASQWNRAQNWSGNFVPGPADIVLIPANPVGATIFPIVEISGQTVGEVSIESGADITVTGGVNFIIQGALTGAGEINGGSTDTLSVGGDLSLPTLAIGTVQLNGTSAQTITEPDTYTDLVIDNAGGVEFSGNLFVNGTLNLASGTAIIPSGANLLANTKTIGSGTLTFEREISGQKGWRAVSAPVATSYTDFLDGTITQGYAGAFYSTGSLPGDTLQPNVLYYEETVAGTDNQRWRAPVNAGDTILPGRGYFVYFFGDVASDPLYTEALPDTLNSTGQEHEGDGTEFNFNVTYTASADTGWNFVGNPFGATLDWDAAGWTKTNIDNTIYVWDPEANGGNGEYLTWNGTTGTLGDGLIAPYQGFWIKANGPSPVLTVAKSNKTTGGNFKRKQPAESASAIVEMTLSYGEMSARTNLMFDNMASTGKDSQDSYRLLPFTDTFVELYTTMSDGTQLVVNHLPEPIESRMLIPLHVGGFDEGQPVSGQATLSWTVFRNLPDNWVVSLVDRRTGEVTDMLSDYSYTFELVTANAKRYKTNGAGGEFKLKEQSLNEGRFTVRVSTQEIEDDIPSKIYLYQNYPNPFNPSTIIEFGLDKDVNVVLDVYDILGRKVRTLIDNRLGAGEYKITFDGAGLASGVYLYRLRTDNFTRVKKFTLIK